MSARDLLKSAVTTSGGFFYKTVYRKCLNKALVVFCYHDVCVVPSEFSRLYSLNVLPAVFDNQIRFIKKDFNIISPLDLIRGNIPQRAALITFDDGFKSYFTNAVPILTQHNVPSMIFLNMAPILGDFFWPGLVAFFCAKRPDFRDFVKMRVLSKLSADKFLFLASTPKIVDEYRQTVRVGDAEINEFIGHFANEEDLTLTSANRLVFYGNHLYAHEAVINLTDQMLWQSFSKNELLLNKYSNYYKMFSFPFGQPQTYYLPQQVDFLLSQGVKVIFDSCGLINFGSQKCYSRMSLTSLHSSELKILFSIPHHNFMAKKSSRRIYND